MPKLRYLLFFALLLAINVLAMPKKFYAGDSVAVKIAAINLVNTGSFGVDFSLRPQLEAFLVEKGELFHENERHQRFYSRWGWFNTAISAVPVLFQSGRSFSGILGDSVRSHNWMNAVIAALAGIYLLMLAQMFTRYFCLALFYSLACLYGTFVWNYLRAQSYELIHLFFFLGLCYHLLASERTRSRGHRLAWKVCLAALVLSKAFYLILFPPLVYALFHGQRARHHGRRESLAYALRETGGLLVFSLVATLAGNFWQFESIWNFGVGRHSELQREPSWSFIYFGVRLHDYFINPSTNLFLCFPPLVLVAAGWPRFHRQYGVASRLFLGGFLLTLFVVGGFYGRGEWCYGPRFFLFLLPATALVALPVLEQAIQEIKKPAMGLLVLSCVLITLASVRMQMIVNRHPFFLKQRMHGLFWSLHKDPQIEDYFLSYPTPLVNRGIERFERGEGGFFPVEHIKEMKPPETWVPYEAFIRKNLMELDAGNYFWGN